MKGRTKHVGSKVAVLTLAWAMSMSAVGATLTASAGLSDHLDANKKYVADYDTMDEMMDAAADLNVEIAQEGMTLMKNRDNALPLSRAENRVTLLGDASVSLATDGGGSGAQSTPANGAQPNTLKDSLNAAGIKVNPRTLSLYESLRSSKPVSTGCSGGTIVHDNNKYMKLVTKDGEVEFDGKQYASASDGVLSGIEGNFDIYGDAAIVTFKRSGTEGGDQSTNNVLSYKDTDAHYLQLNESEKEVLAYAKLHFDKVIVLLNSPAVMEIGALADDDGIDAVVYIGQPGVNGIMALGKLLTGEVNFSGRTVDFYMRDLKKDPTWYNFGNYQQANYIVNGEYGNSSSTVTMNHDITVDESQSVEHAIDYAEGIYVGYRYYETVAADLGAAGEEWYQKATAYPFGHGLSYTSFEQEIIDVKGDLSNTYGKVTVSVKVTNTGKVAGKDVVQLYNTAPYTPGGIDKAAVNLVGFAKTNTLKAGKSQTMDITIDVKDLASFDYNDANKNQNFGYELETGNYVLSIRENSHDVIDSRTLTCSKLLTWEEDSNPDTPNNIFSQPVDSKWGQFNTLSNAWTTSGKDHYLTRDGLVDDGNPADLKDLAWLLTEDNEFTPTAFSVLDSRRSAYSYDDYDDAKTSAVETNYENLWTKKASDIPDNWTQGAGQVQADTQRYKIELYDMIGVPYNDPQWDTFLNQLTWDELISLMGSGSYKNAAIPNIGKPQLIDQDGPIQLKPNRSQCGWAWVSAVLVASTWNTELAEKQGRMVGNESMILGANGWYGPAMNTHRNPLAGRNFEYYSQDGVQGGLIAAAVVKGATDMGVHVYIKHAFLNDQETNRTGGVSFATEQAIREIYAKPFELAIKKGNANGLMSAFNLVGLQPSTSYAINQQLYRNEWGFEGFSVTDMYSDGATGWNGWSLFRGNTFPLGSVLAKAENVGVDGKWDATARDGKGMVKTPAYDATTKTASTTKKMDSPTTWYWARDLAKNYLFTIANGNALDNGYASYMLKTNTSLALQEAKEIAKGTNILSAAALSELEDTFGYTGYELTAKGLPAGVKMDTAGVLSGTPAESGDIMVELTVKGKFGLNYITDTKTIKMSVAAEPHTDVINKVTLDKKTAEFNKAYTGTVTQSAITLTQGTNYIPGGKAEEANLGKYTAFGYTATGLPTGLSINKTTGAITGKPMVNGTFKVLITAEFTKVIKQERSGRVTYTTEKENYTSTYFFTVSGAFNVTFKENYEGGKTQMIGIASGSTATFGDIKANIQAPKRADSYVFLGWATKANATAADVTDATVFTNETTLYAVWQMPAVTLIDGEWWVNGINTHVKAAGTPGSNGFDGQDGDNGKDGVTPTIKISEDGYWVINGTKTDTKAIGTNGKDGTDGKDGKNGSGGCKSVLLADAGVAAGALLIVGGVLLLKRKQRND